MVRVTQARYALAILVFGVTARSGAIVSIEDLRVATKPGFSGQVVQANREIPICVP